MQMQTPVVRDLLLLGGGHSHVQVLKHFAMHPVPGIRLTLISDDYVSPYSGMVPGFIAGHYNLDEIQIALEPLCRGAGARFICARVIGLDRDERRVLMAGRPPLRYDYLSINSGARPDLKGMPGIAVKPINGFLAQWPAVFSSLQVGEQPMGTAKSTPYGKCRASRSSLILVGAGAGGVEMAFAGNVTVVNSSVPEHPQAQTIYGCFHGLHRSEQWIRLELRPIRKLDLLHDMPLEFLYLTMLRTVRGLTSEELEQYMARDDAGKHAMFASIGTEIMTDETDTQKEFECEAGQQLCEYRGIIELDRIEYPAYIVRTVLYSSAFSDISNPTAPEIDEIQFQLQHGTSSETTYLALFKLLSLGISYVAWMKYKDQLRRLRAASRSEEQLLLQHLLFCLMLFNDPFYVFEVLLGGSLLPIVSVMFEVTYWAMLLLFWGVAVDRTRLEAEDKRFERRDFYENKLKLCGVFWFSTVFVFCGNLEEARSDPINGTMMPTFLDKFFT